MQSCNSWLKLRHNHSGVVLLELWISIPCLSLRSSPGVVWCSILWSSRVALSQPLPVAIHCNSSWALVALWLRRTSWGLACTPWLGSRRPFLNGRLLCLDMWRSLRSAWSSCCVPTWRCTAQSNRTLCSGTMGCTVPIAALVDRPWTGTPLGAWSLGKRRTGTLRTWPGRALSGSSISSSSSLLL